MSRPQLRLPEKLNFLDRDYEMLSLPKQLDRERIDNFIKFHGVNVLLSEDDACRKRLNKMRSVAERIHNYMKTHANVTYDVLNCEDFFDVQEFAEENIINEWTLSEFIDFFCKRVKFIWNRRQLEGKYSHWAEIYKTGDKGRDPNRLSLKQEFRTNKNEWLMK